MQRSRAGGESSSYGGPTIELEDQVILRLPSEPAKALREALRSGAGNIRDRLKLKIEPEKNSTNPCLRRGSLVFDGWSMSAKLVDLPTIIESQKTIDKKTFYKTADISQMLICKEGEDTEEDSEDNSPKKPKKDPNKVDKKYVFKHGYTRPMKNCRRRRFRKTLKKKFVEGPEVEKEVKRLLKYDIEASSIKFELVTEEELSATRTENGRGANEEEEFNPIDEQELFGAISDDSEEDMESKDVDIDSDGEESNTMMFDESSQSQLPSQSNSSLNVTEFSKDMFSSESNQEDPTISSNEEARPSAVAVKLESSKKEIEQLKTKKAELERNIANCDNQALLQRFQQSLMDVEEELSRKESDLEAFAMFN